MYNNKFNETELLKQNINYLHQVISKQQQYQVIDKPKSRES